MIGKKSRFDDLQKIIQGVNVPGERLELTQILLLYYFLKYVSKISELNFEIVAVTRPCIRFF